MKHTRRFLAVLIAVVMMVGVVPVIQVTLAAAPEFDWSAMGAADGTGSADDLSNIGTQDAIIQFGAYPQTKETDTATVTELNSLASDWKSYDYYSGNGDPSNGQMQSSNYMQYCDVEYGSNKYRGVTFSQYRPYLTGCKTSDTNNKCQRESGYTKEKTYWFKYEPLQWKVLDPSERLVLCVSIIDSQPYNNYILSSGTDPRGDTAFWGDIGKTHYANDYANSSMRKWLNETFYTTAFTTTQQNCIALNRNQNNDGYYTLTGNTNYTDYDSAPTSDKIFLLSYDEALNSSYGFATSASTYDRVKTAIGTDYAKCQGLFVHRFSGSTYDGNSFWWLRSPSGSNNACCVCRYGDTAINNFVGDSCCGIRPAMCIDLDAFTGAVNENEYIRKHLTFASATTMPENFGFYNKIWNEENGRRLGWVKTWEVIGDIGEIATFKFDDLEITANFYDLFLSDLILKLTEQSYEKFELKYFECFNDIYEPIKNILKTTEEWNNSVIEGSDVDLEIDGFLLDPDYNMSYGSFIRLNDILGEAFTKDSELWNEVFAGLNNVSMLCDYVTDAADIVQAFREANKAYAVAMAFQEVNDEFFTIMYQAANSMENQTYANWFRNTLDHYFEIAHNGNAEFERSLSLFKDFSHMTYDRLFKNVFKNLTYQGIASLLNCAAGSVGIATFAYNTTYGLMDKICKLDKKTKAYELMTYVAPIEKAMCALEDDYANILIGSQSLESAQNYDYFYTLYKNVNLYLYQAAYDFTSATFFRKNKATELEVISRCTDQWKRSSCHAGLSQATVKKYSGVYCPVDVYAYDSEGQVLLEIINDEIVSCDESITALTFDGKKSVIYPADQDYTIKIVSREDGDMDYYVSEIDGESSLRQVEFYDIPIAENQVFDGDIPEAFDVDKTAYELRTNDVVVSSNFDSNECTCETHSTLEWRTLQAPTCIEKGEKVGYCADCGKEMIESVDINASNHVNTTNVTATASTCTVKGYTAGVYCNDCKQYISGHAEQPLAAHTLTTINQRNATCTAEGYTGDQYCTTCQQTISTGTTVGKTAHTLTVINQRDATYDADGYTGDQYCTTCQQTITTGTVIPKLEKPTDPQPQPSGGCKWCGKTHGGAFGWLVKLFHNLFAAIFGAKY